MRARRITNLRPHGVHPRRQLGSPRATPCAAPADAFAELLSAYKDAISKWCDIFLGDTFVGGSTPSIADYKAASFLIVAVHPALKEMCPTWEPPARVRTFMDDFTNKVCCASIMHAGFGGNSICEFIHKKSIENKAKRAAA